MDKFNQTARGIAAKLSPHTTSVGNVKIIADALRQCEADTIRRCAAAMGEPPTIAEVSEAMGPLTLDEMAPYSFTLCHDFARIRSARILALLPEEPGQ